MVGTGITTYATAAPAEIRCEVLETLIRVTEADAAFWYAVSSENRLSSAIVVGSPRIEQHLSCFMGAPLPDGAASSASTQSVRARRGRWSLTTAPATTRKRFRGLFEDFESPESFAALRVFDAFYRPCRISDQLRLLPFRDGRFLGWIGVVRTDGTRFEPATRAAVDAQVGQVEESLATARALESIDDPSAYLLARPDGAVEQATEPALRWLTLERDAILRRAVCAADQGELDECRIDGVSVRFVRLDGSGGVRYLATLTDDAGLSLSRAACLTPVEHLVAVSAAAGLRVHEIAEEHALSPNTVKSHLKSVYRKLEVASRVELAEALDAG